MTSELAKRTKALGLPVIEERAKALIAKFDGAGDGCFSAVETEEMATLLRHALHHLGTLSAHAALHPTGRCSCHGEGRCQWCLMMAERERADDARDENRRLRDLFTEFAAFARDSGWHHLSEEMLTRMRGTK